MAKKSNGAIRDSKKSQRMLNNEARRKQSTNIPRDKRDIFANRMMNTLANSKTEQETV